MSDGEAASAAGDQEVGAKRKASPEEGAHGDAGGGGDEDDGAAAAAAAGAGGVSEDRSSSQDEIEGSEARRKKAKTDAETDAPDAETEAALAGLESDSDDSSDEKGAGKKLKKGAGAAADAETVAALAGLESDSDDSSDDTGAKRKRLLKKGGGKKLKKGASKKRKKGSKKPKNDDDDGGDGFIASDDDNKDIKASYDAQKEHDSDDDPYGDEDNLQEADDGPMEGERSAARGRNKRAGAPADEEEIDTSTFSGMLKQVNRKRAEKKREHLVGEDAMGSFCEDILKRMRECVLRDNEARSKKRPATHKLGMLDEVEMMLLRKDLQEKLLEGGVLACLRDWMSPSRVDKMLPAQSIRSRIIAILPQLPIETSDLSSSGFGKVVNFLRNHPKELAKNKEILTSLMHKWSREIYVRRDAGHPEAIEEVEPGVPSPTKPRRKKRPEAAGAGGLDRLADKKARAAAAAKRQEDKGSFRARIPQQMNFDFKRRPTSNIKGDEDNKMDQLRPSAKRLELEKKLLAARKKRKA